MIVYGDMISSSYLKVKFTFGHLGIPYTCKPSDVVKDATRSPEFLGELKIQPVH